MKLLLLECCGLPQLANPQLNRLLYRSEPSETETTHPP
jgi:hypothetical protein